MKFSDIISAVSTFIESESSAAKAKSAAKEPPTPVIRESGLGDCVLCKKPIPSIDERLSLSCKHGFHFECIQKWAETNNRCPECSQAFY